MTAITSTAATAAMANAMMQLVPQQLEMAARLVQARTPRQQREPKPRLQHAKR